MADRSHDLPLLSHRPLSYLVRDFLSASVILLCLREIVNFLVRTKQKYTKKVDLPVLNLKGTNYRAAEQSYVTDLIHWLKLGRERFSKGFQLWGPEGYLVILPDDSAEELKDVDDSFADNTALAKGVMGDKLYIDVVRVEIRDSLKLSLTPKMGAVMHDICNEMNNILRTEFPPCEDWTTWNPYFKCLRMISLISGRAFVGAELCRDEKWLQTNIDYTIDLFRSGEAVRSLPYPVRNAAINLHLVPKVNKLWQYEKYAVGVLVPILQKRIKEQAENPKAEKPRDMLQWIMEYARTMKPPLSLDKQAKTQLVLGMSAIHASSIALVNFLLDLVAYPEYGEPLREEVDQVWDEYNGTLEKQAMSKLVKLDSFLKESQRLHPASHITFDREITNKKGFTLSNGLHLPQGTHYAIASSLIAKSETPWSNAEEFDGFRAAKLRQNPGDSHKYQFVGTNPHHSMAFSHGKHACPGRFFAANEIKVIMAYMIRHFDLKCLPDREGKRPESLVFGHNLQPDPSVNILVKKREKW